MLQERLHHLDWLRALCFALLTPYHAAIAVQVWPFFSAYTVENAALRWFMDLVAPWRLPALFFTAGAAALAALQKSPDLKCFLRQRRDRLLYPLLFGILVIVPPMVYVERVWNGGRYEGYLDFYPDFFQGLYPAGNFSWHHLWFLAYLFVISTAFAGAVHLAARWNLKDAVMRRLRENAAAFPVLWIGAAMLSETLLRPESPSTHALFNDRANLAQYSIAFLGGAAYGAVPEIRRNLNALPPYLWLVAVACFAGALIVDPDPIGHGLRIGAGFAVALALIGVLQKSALAARPLPSRFQEAILPVYILHNTILIAGASALLRADISILELHFALTFAGVAGSLLIYSRLVAPFPWMRRCFGLSPRQGDATPAVGILEYAASFFVFARLENHLLTNSNARPTSDLPEDLSDEFWGKNDRVSNDDRRLPQDTLSGAGQRRRVR
jgi:glucans biosynthesis protein C